MKYSRSKQFEAGYTLGEIMVAASCATLVGIMATVTLLAGFNLYARITANNLAHDESRIAVNRLVSDIHKAVSTPQLYDASATATNGLVTITSATTNASCLAFQTVPDKGGPWEVKNDPGNSELIQIDTNGWDPQLGMRLIIPLYNIENDIIKVESNGNHKNIWMANGEERIPKSKNGTYVITYFTSRIFYAVEGGELRIYASGVDPDGGTNYNGVITPSVSGGKLVFKNGNGTAARYAVVARYITSPKPFTVPNYPDTRYVGVNLTTSDTHYTNRGFVAVNTLVAGSIPYRAKICQKN
jgi:hypothetical protein